MWGRYPHGEPVPSLLADADAATGTGFGVSEYDALVLALAFTLTTSGAPGVRRPGVTFTDQSGRFAFTVSLPFTISAGKVSRVSFVLGALEFGASDAAVMGGPLPAFPVLPLGTVAVSVDAAAAGDTLTDAGYVLQRLRPLGEERD